MSYAPQARVELCSTLLRIKSTWWKRFQRENLSHYNESFRTTSSTCSNTVTPWSLLSSVCMKSHGEATAAVPLKPVTSSSWTTFSKTSQLAIGGIWKGHRRGGPTLRMGEHSMKERETSRSPWKTMIIEVASIKLNWLNGSTKGRQGHFWAYSTQTLNSLQLTISSITL